jgi:glycopeptide antibiotics resistance protein
VNVRKAVAAAFLLSLAAESSQLLSRRRIPSVTDVVTNTAGAWIGAGWARSRSARSDPEIP